jgi:hypothetical protein
MIFRTGSKRKKQIIRLYRERILNKRFDEFGRAIFRRAQISDAEAEEIASSPFLYARVRARINAEKDKRRSALSEGWLESLLAARRIFTGMALTALAAILVWLSMTVFIANGRLTNADDNALAANESRFEQIVYTENNASDSEVLATITEQDEDEQR